MLRILNTTVGIKSNSVSARELHKRLEIQKDFTDWIKNQIKRGRGLKEGIDFIVVWVNHFEGVVDSTPFLQENNPFLSESELLQKFNSINQAIRSGYQSDYLLTIDNSKHIALMSETAKGEEVRDYFIQVEKDHQILLEQHQALLLAQAKEETQHQALLLAQAREERQHQALLLAQAKEETARKDLLLAQTKEEADTLREACSNNSIKVKTTIQKLETTNQKLETTIQQLQTKLDVAMNKRVLKEYNGYKSISLIHQELNIVSPTLSEFFDLFRQQGYIESVPCTKNRLATANIGDQDSRNNPRFSHLEVANLLKTTNTQLLGTPESRLQLIAEIEAETENAN